MSETKYGKYFVVYDPEIWRSSPSATTPVVIRLEDKVVSGSNFYFLHWVFPGQRPPEAAAAALLVGHPPHAHPYAEIILHIGTDPKDPMDLGAEVELCMGPEMEKHLITKTSAVYIPANFIHCPYNIRKTIRPFLVMQILQGPKRIEEPHPEILPKEIRDKIDWSFWNRIREDY